MIEVKEIAISNPKPNLRDDNRRRIIIPEAKKVIYINSKYYHKPINPTIRQTVVSCPDCKVGHITFNDIFFCGQSKQHHKTKDFEVLTERCKPVRLANLHQYEKAKVGVYLIWSKGKERIFIKEGEGLYKLKIHGHYEYHVVIQTISNESK